MHEPLRESVPSIASLPATGRAASLGNLMRDIKRSMLFDLADYRRDPTLLTPEVRTRLVELGEAIVQIIEQAAGLLNEMQEVGAIEIDLSGEGGFLPRILDPECAETLEAPVDKVPGEKAGGNAEEEAGPGLVQNDDASDKPSKEIGPRPSLRDPRLSEINQLIVTEKLAGTVDYIAKIGAIDCSLSLTDHEIFIMEVLAKIDLEPFARKLFLDNGFFESGTFNARVQAFRKAMSSLRKKLEVATGREIVGSSGERATRMYYLEESIEIIDRKSAAKAKEPSPIPLAPRPKAPHRHHRTARTASHRRISGPTPLEDAADAGMPEPPEADATPALEQVDSDGEPENSNQFEAEEEVEERHPINPGLLKKEVVESDDESIGLREAARMAVLYSSTSLARAKGTAKPLNSVNGKVLFAHFGLDRETMLGIEEICLDSTINFSGSLTPMSVKAMIRDSLKKIDRPEAKAYLEYLDNQ